MIIRRSNLPIALTMTVFLMSAGHIGSAAAAPQNPGSIGWSQQNEALVQIDHRRHHGGGWQGGRGWHRELGPRQIRRSLRHRGFHKIRILDRRGPMYIIKARGWRGMPVRLVVDSRTAEIVRSRPMGRRFHWSYSW